MKRGTGEEKVMGTMFPRLHVNDTEKGGPRAPPRNKMALYEQLSIPSQLYNPGDLPHNSSNSTVLPHPSQENEHERGVFFSRQLPALGHPVEKPYGLSSGSNTPLREVKSKRQTEKKDFRVPTFGNSKERAVNTEDYSKGTSDIEKRDGTLKRTDQLSHVKPRENLVNTFGESHKTNIVQLEFRSDCQVDCTVFSGSVIDVDNDSQEDKTCKSSQTVEFLEPSAETQLVIGFDCEGVDLCRHGTLCIMQFSFPDAIYLVDAVQGGEAIVQACKPALESNYITKVIHDCKRDSEALYFQFGIKLHNVVDTQIAYSLINEQEGQARVPDCHISFVGLLADPRYCGVSYDEKEEVRVLLRQDPKYWTYRPLSEQMIRAAADDVRFLLHIYHKMVQKLNGKSLWNLAVRGALYCRCFCINDNHFADWPPLPPIPETLLLTEVSLKKKFCLLLMFPRGKWDVLLAEGELLYCR